MHPILFGEGAWALPSYFAMAMLGFLVASSLARRDAIRQKINFTQIVDLSILLMIVGVLGARFFHVLFDGHLQDYMNLCMDPDALALELPGGGQCSVDQQCVDAQNRGYDIGPLCNTDKGQCVPEQDCLRSAKFWTGGLVWYGGLIFSTLFLGFYARFRMKLSALRIGDLYAAPGILGLAFGRFGCFLSGCCFGDVCEIPAIGVHFPKYSDAWDLHRSLNPPPAHGSGLDIGQHLPQSLAVHPTQLYEAFGSLMIFVILWFGIRKHSRYEGQAVAWMMILYSITRFSIESLRADERGALLALSTSQWISIVLAIFGGFLIWNGHRAMKKAAGVPSSDASEEARSETAKSEEEMDDSEPLDVP